MSNASAESIQLESGSAHHASDVGWVRRSATLSSSTTVVGNTAINADVCHGVKILRRSAGSRTPSCTSHLSVQSVRKSASDTNIGCVRASSLITVGDGRTRSIASASSIVLQKTIITLHANNRCGIVASYRTTVSRLGAISAR